MTNPWLIVAGDFTPLGGMDAANYHLAKHLAAGGRAEVHLVTHRVWPDLAALPSVNVHEVPRPFGRHAAGAPLLAWAGRRWAGRLQTRGARVVANGGNCATTDVNWVHYLHAAFAPAADLGPSYSWRASLQHARWVRQERRALGRSRLIICNSRRTAAAVREHLHLPDDRIRIVYYGCAPARFGPVGADERREARRELGCGDRPVVAFVGALGDRRKGFDVLFEAWRRLAGDRRWDAELIAAGAGRELGRWRHRAAAAGLGGQVRLLGFRTDVPRILAAADLLVHPARYEPYGLVVHEALCRGIPAFVTASAGAAERYPGELADLLIADPENVAALADRLEVWRGTVEETAGRVQPLGAALRAVTWDDMAREIATAAA